ncbi:MAG: cytochrome c peroxidase [Phycisphaerae bacterium]
MNTYLSRMGFAMGVAFLAAAGALAQVSPIEQLGRSLLTDNKLSAPAGQSCVACHGASAGYTGPSSSINAHGAVYPGAIHRRFGNRKPPTAAYAGDSPVLHYDADGGTWVGGMFWDGRATGWMLGDPLVEQAMGPFLNPLEQNNPSKTAVVWKVALSSYAPLFRQVWGPDSLPWDPDAPALSRGGFDFSLAYERIARSIAAFERSREVSPFTSKYDFYLAGVVQLTAQEMQGFSLFNGVAMCSQCHPSSVGPSGERPLFTDFTYDNLGVPRNPENPFYTMSSDWNPNGPNWVDHGLGGFLQSAGYSPDVYGPEIGKQKVPTLRNVARRPKIGFVKAFGHNGFFKSLEQIVHFYNTRDVLSWPPPEVPDNVNRDELGDLGLTPEEEAAIVAFLRTLSDGYVPPQAP